MLPGDTIAVDRPIYVLVVTVVGRGRVRSGVARTHIAGGCRVGLSYPSVLRLIGWNFRLSYPIYPSV